MHKTNRVLKDECERLLWQQAHGYLSARLGESVRGCTRESPQSTVHTRFRRTRNCRCRWIVEPTSRAVQGQACSYAHVTQYNFNRADKLRVRVASMPRVPRFQVVFHLSWLPSYLDYLGVWCGISDRFLRGLQVVLVKQAEVCFEVVCLFSSLHFQGTDTARHWMLEAASPSIASFATCSIAELAVATSIASLRHLVAVQKTGTFYVARISRSKRAAHNFMKLWSSTSTHVVWLGITLNRQYQAPCDSVSGAHPANLL